MHIRDSKPIPNRNNICLILGRPGIGKTWLLSYVLGWGGFWRGSPLFSRSPIDWMTPTASSIQFTTINGNGARQMASPSASELGSPDVWVLVDQTPVGAPREAGDHSWLVVVTS